MREVKFGIAKLAIVSMTLAVAGSAFAKLPAPTPEKAPAAAAAKDKAAWGDKVAAYQLCKSQDKVADYYRKHKEGASKQTVETPACADPGPYVAPAAPAAPAASAVPAAPAAPVANAAQAAAPAKK